MKRLLFLYMTLFAVTIAFAQNDKYAELKFDSVEYDFGSFYKDANQLSHTFTFTNTGNAPAVINQVVTTCGCTVATYTKEPVAPGKKGSVNVVYNVTGRFPGEFKKVITIRTNAKKPTTKLYIKGNMLDRP